jgi:hypothetical protein
MDSRMKLPPSRIGPRHPSEAVRFGSWSAAAPGSEAVRSSRTPRSALPVEHGPLARSSLSPSAETLRRQGRRDSYRLRTCHGERVGEGAGANMLGHHDARSGSLIQSAIQERYSEGSEDRTLRGLRPDLTVDDLAFSSA